MTEASAQRIKSIHVRKLFGVYDHDIPLNINERVTIIHGPNGVGKTALLRLTNALLLGNYLTILKTPFEKFEIRFLDEVLLRAVKSKKPTKNNALIIDKIDVKKNSKTIFSTDDSAKHFERALMRASDHIPFLHQIGPDTWIDSRTESKLSADDLLNKFPEILYDQPTFFDNPRKSGLKSASVDLRVHFIEAQRLLSFVPKSREARYREDRQPSMFETVEQYSTELLSALRTVQSKFAAVTQKLEQSFPLRLLKQTAAVNAQELENLQRKISADRQKLVSLGLIAETADRNAEIAESDFVKLPFEKLGTLALYLNDSAEKLKTFDDLASRVDVLLDTINKKFRNKQLKISGERGLFAIGPDGQDLSLKSLSSGEQHEIILLYDMLFKVQKNSLVLLDEPELSFHLEWQRDFLDDLKRVIDIVGFDVIIATHSPYIVGDRSDLLVDLSATLATAA
jgi:predicted ATP-binding protein involved in virulence